MKKAEKSRIQNYDKKYDISKYDKSMTFQIMLSR